MAGTGRILLLSGVLSSLLYAATDVLGGLSYEGYDFTARAVSELGAIGAPSKPLVDPLFIVYDLLVLAFGVGVVREGLGRNRALRIVGIMLTAYGAVGFVTTGLAGATFAMHPRGGPVSNDLPHIALTGALVLLLLVAIGAGTFALGRRFRAYSLATLATMIIFGALTTRYPPLMEAGLPTPGFGTIERIDIYAPMLWIALLAIALLRRRDDAARRTLP